MAWRIFFQPWRWRKGNVAKALEARIRQDFTIRYAVAFESGRTSLTTLLQTSGLAAGDEVALQAYTCVAVPNAVLWAGLKPIYIDCLRDTLTMSPRDVEKKITPRTKAIIIQYTFGQVGALDEILKIAREKNLIVIEDCAHVIGGKHHGQLLGTVGDASFFSFGRDKVISGVFGGMALTNNDDWGKRLRAAEEKYNFPDYLWIWQQINHPIVTMKAKLLYRIGLGKVIFRVAQKLHWISKTVVPAERNGKKPPFVFRKMPNALARLTLHQYEKLERFNTHRKSIGKWYREKLRGNQTYELLREEEESIPLRFFVQVENPNDLIRFAKKESIYLGDWYNEAVAPTGVQYERIGYQEGSCPVAEELAKHSVNLPVDIHSGEKEAKRVIDTLQKYSEEKK